MADDKKPGSWDYLRALVVLGVLYGIGMWLLRGSSHETTWWHHLVAIPLAFIYALGTSAWGSQLMAKSVLVPLSGIVVAFVLIKRGCLGWTCAAGIGYVLLAPVYIGIAYYVEYKANQEGEASSSQSLVINAIATLVVGLGMLIAGIIAYFV